MPLTHLVSVFTDILSKINDGGDDDDDDDDDDSDRTRISRLRATKRKHFPAKTNFSNCDDFLSHVDDWLNIMAIRNIEYGK